MSPIENPGNDSEEDEGMIEEESKGKTEYSKVATPANLDLSDQMLVLAQEPMVKLAPKAKVSLTAKAKTLANEEEPLTSEDEGKASENVLITKIADCLIDRSDDDSEIEFLVQDIDRVPSSTEAKMITTFEKEVQTYYGDYMAPFRNFLYQLRDKTTREKSKAITKLLKENHSRKLLVAVSGRISTADTR
jgi:hypothetical protein